MELIAIQACNIHVSKTGSKSMKSHNHTNNIITVAGIIIEYDQLSPQSCKVPVHQYLVLYSEVCITNIDTYSCKLSLPCLYERSSHSL